jgi:hypothetical protein
MGKCATSTPGGGSSSGEAALPARRLERSVRCRPTRNPIGPDRWVASHIQGSPPMVRDAFTNSEKQVRTVNVILVLMARKVRVGLILNATTRAKNRAPRTPQGLHNNRAADLKHAWNGLRQVCAPPRGRSGENSSDGLNARWIAMWPVRSLVHLVVPVIPDNRDHR